MTRQEVYAKLTPLFQRVFDNETLLPTDQMTAAEVPQWDSLSHINLIIATEKYFKIRFQTAEVISLKNVGEFVDAILRKNPATP